MGTPKRRLVTFGCSITYGHGLSDCITNNQEPGDVPSEFSWPAVLSQSLDLELVNQGECGASNHKILCNILQYNFKPDDIVVIMWTFPDRDLIYGKKNFFTGKQAVSSIGIWVDDELATNWKATHSAEDNSTKTWFHLHHSYLHLKLLNLKSYNFIVDYDMIKRYKPKFINVPLHNIKVSKLNVDFALDNMHPGPQTHKNIAEKIKDITLKCK